uniref:MotA/TolQ/ExbB proton channel family protein n=1 Tax=Acidocella sp. C78 TaxID=1671486 RepID=UPI0027DC475E|nr:MotA/TolQ/ExbB proton channel family protein [Acidocella sp. C78]
MAAQAHARRRAAHPCGTARRGVWQSGRAARSRREPRHHAASHLIATALASRGETADELDNHLEEEIMDAMPRITRGLWILDTAVTIAPLLGLFGTIIGMIQAFDVLSSNGGPAKVTGGIADALVSTGAGLLIAIIAVYLVNYFNNLTRRIVQQLELVKSC